MSGPPRWQLALVLGIGIGLLVLVWGAAGNVLRPRDATPAGDEVGQTAQDAEDASAPADDGRRQKGAQAGTAVDVTRLARQVAQLRELPLKRRLNTRVSSATALGDKVSELAFSETDPKEVRQTQRLLVALRLAPPETDLLEVSEKLYREQILGLYVPKERTLYVRQGDRDSPLQRMTTVHEITHALQDQSFNLVRLQRHIEDDSEAAAALLALVEGDAVLTQQLWGTRHLTGEELRRAMTEAAGSDEALSDAPEYLRASLFFPYQEGSQFVAELFRAGGFQAINDAFADPPTTTEQIMHPQRYIERDEPVAIRVGAEPGARWRPDASHPFGEFDLQQMFGAVGPDTADTAAEGWGGGEIRSWRRGTRVTVAAALAFDSSNDAAEACDAVRRWYIEVADARQSGPGVYVGDVDHMAVSCTDREVRFGLAPTAAGARTASSG
ncbi:MAG: hypothetical protein GEU74_13815 [Nitriliruptorales bacterium]|nr:hypothetical protein [Nitriliruptorales bacterium]